MRGLVTTIWAAVSTMGVVGTSWYSGIGCFRWRTGSCGSDAAIKAVQVNVLGHVKALSEADELKVVQHGLE